MVLFLGSVVGRAWSAYLCLKRALAGWLVPSNGEECFNNWTLEEKGNQFEEHLESV